MESTQFGKEANQFGWYHHRHCCRYLSNRWSSFSSSRSSYWLKPQSDQRWSLGLTARTADQALKGLPVGEQPQMEWKALSPLTNDGPACSPTLPMWWTRFDDWRRYVTYSSKPSRYFRIFSAVWYSMGDILWRYHSIVTVLLIDQINEILLWLGFLNGELGLIQHVFNLCNCA